MTGREEIVVCARSYINTPFHHRERKPGLALDCAGVLVCCARQTRRVAPDFDVPAYVDYPDGRTLLAWCKRYMGHPVSQSALQPGDGIVVKTDKLPQHLGVVADYQYGGGLSIVHASNVANPPRVIETRLMFARGFHFVSAFAFPGID